MRDPIGWRVYPRGCGGTSDSIARTSPEGGLSPRVRGNPSYEASRGTHGGSIPAGAGEPTRNSVANTRIRVYPRGCGGTPTPTRLSAFVRGLSPRVRGNLKENTGILDRGGAIPAGAGEPERGWRSNRLRWVYPRGCGGTQKVLAFSSRRVGLSPRVRGNHAESQRNRVHGRSIPAGAGEPDERHRGSRHGRVYPRGCGGTAFGHGDQLTGGGLSPRVRGNQRPGETYRERCGSIPAGAGEPATSAQVGGTTRVYPRGCGGTRSKQDRATPRLGLSPRVRGNLQWQVGQHTKVWSIPAGAGEPQKPLSSPFRKLVYPRGCGGTTAPSLCSKSPSGLSPRVRGNPAAAVFAIAKDGSIPAGAGEP